MVGCSIGDAPGSSNRKNRTVSKTLALHTFLCATVLVWTQGGPVKLLKNNYVFNPVYDFAGTVSFTNVQVPSTSPGRLMGMFFSLSVLVASPGDAHNSHRPGPGIP